MTIIRLGDNLYNQIFVIRKITIINKVNNNNNNNHHHHHHNHSNTNYYKLEECEGLILHENCLSFKFSERQRSEDIFKVFMF